MNVLVSKKINDPTPLPKTSSLIKTTLMISIPAALETFLVGLVGLIDTVMVSSLGEEAIAAISIAQQPVFISLAACIGLNVGVIAIVARKHGQNDKEGANRSFRQTLMLGAIAAAIFTVLCIIFAKPFMRFAGAEDDTIDLSTSYFQIVSTALLFNYLRLIICSALRAIGKTNLTLITNIIANIINIFLNFCLITGRLGFPGLGVNGAAIATIAGNIVAFIVGFIAIYKSKGFLSIRFRDQWKFDKQTTSQIFHVSSGAFLDQLFVRVGFFISAMIINYLGTGATAINAIANSVIVLAFNLVDGFSIGCSSLVGRSLGQKKPSLAYAYARIAQICAIFIAIFITAIIMIFRFPLASLFSDKTDVVTEATKLLMISGFIILPQSIQWTTNGALKGAGDTKYVAVTGMVTILIVRPLASFILCYPLGLGLIGAWGGMIFQQVARMTMNLVRFERLKWINTAI